MYQFNTWIKLYISTCICSTFVRTCVCFDLITIIMVRFLLWKWDGEQLSIWLLSGAWNPSEFELLSHMNKWSYQKCSISFVVRAKLVSSEQNFDESILFICCFHLFLYSFWIRVTKTTTMFWMNEIICNSVETVKPVAFHKDFQVLSLFRKLIELFHDYVDWCMNANGLIVFRAANKRSPHDLLW